MAGLDQLQIQDYQGRLSPGAQYAMNPLNALWAYNQQQNIQQGQQNTLQNQQNELAGSGLEAAVANRSNTPEGVAALSNGAIGTANTKYAQGEEAVAALPAKRLQALTALKMSHIDDTAASVEDAISKLTVNGPLGMEAITDPEIKAAVQGAMSANKQLTPMTALQQMQQGITATKIEKMKQESLAKGAATIQASENSANARMYSADSRAAATVDAAKLRKDISNFNPSQIAAHKASQLASLERAYQTARTGIRSAALRPELEAAEYLKLDSWLAQQKSELIGIYDEAERRSNPTGASATPPKASLTPEQRAAIIQRLTGGK